MTDFVNQFANTAGVAGPAGFTNAFAAPTATSGGPLTAGDYRTQSLQGILKVSQVNPEMGQHLLDAYKARTQPASKGFFGGLVSAVTGHGWNVFGDIAGTIGWGVSHVPGGPEAMDLLSKPSSMIAGAFVHDPGMSFGDREKAALFGQKHYNFAQVLAGGTDKPQNGLEKVVGFGLDVAADPTTYLMGGLGGIAKETAVKAAVDVTEAGTKEALLKEVAEKGGLQVGGNFVKAGQEFSLNVAQQASEKMLQNGVSKDFAQSFGVKTAQASTARVFKGLDDFITQEAAWRGRAVGDAVLQRGSASALGKDLVSEVTGLPVGRDEMLKFVKEAGNLKPTDIEGLVNKSGYLSKFLTGGIDTSTLTDAARQKLITQAMTRPAAAKAALGGLRFGVSLPFAKTFARMSDSPWLAYRWQSGVLSSAFGWNPARSFGNYFRGTSWLGRAEEAIADPAIDFAAADRDFALQRGIGDLKKAMIDDGRGADYGKVFGTSGLSAYLSSAERMGGFTSHFTKYSRMLRTDGFIGLRERDVLQRASAVKNQVYEVAQEFAPEWRDTMRQFRAAGADRQTLHNYLDYVEGVTDDAAVLPEYMRPMGDQMRQKFVDLGEFARQHNANIGDATVGMAERAAGRKITATQGLLTEMRDGIKTSVTDLKAQLEKLPEDAKDGRRAIQGQIDHLRAQDSFWRGLTKDTGAKRQLWQDTLGTGRAAEVGDEVDALSQYLNHVVRGDKDFAQWDEQALRKVFPDVAEQAKTEGSDFMDLVSRRAADDMLTTLKQQAAKKLEALGHERDGIVSQLERGEDPALRTRLGEIANEQKTLTDVGNKTLESMSADSALERMHAYRGVIREMRGNEEMLQRFPTRYLHRRFTIEAREAIRGSIRAGTKVFGKAKEKSLSLERKLADMPLVDAENTVRQLYPQLAKVKSIFEHDPAEIFSRYVDDLAEEVYKAKLGQGVTTLANDLGGIDSGKIINLVNDPVVKETRAHMAALAKNIGDKRRDLGKLVSDFEDRVAKSLAHPLTLDEFKDQAPQVAGYDYVVEKGQGVYKRAEEARAADKEMLKRAEREGAPGDAKLVGGKPKAPGTVTPAKAVSFDEVHQDYLKQWADNKAAHRGFDLNRLHPQTKKRYEALAHEINMTRAELEGVKATPQAAMVPLDKVTDQRMWGRVDLPGLENHAIHPFMAQEINKAWYGLDRLPGPLENFRRMYRQYLLGPYKTMATILNPSFHVHKFMGMYFNNWMGGVAPEHYVESSLAMLARHDPAKYGEKIWRDQAVIDGKLEKGVTYNRLNDIIDSTGAIGHFNSEIADLRNYGRRWDDPYYTGPEAVQQAARKLPNVHPVEKYRNAMSKAFVVDSGFHRTAAMIKGLDDSVGDTMAARAFTVMRSGDYAELTDLESNLKDLIPYYKWMRTNIPYQLRMLLEKPGKSLAVEKLGGTILPYDKRGDVPEWERQDPIIFPIGKGKLNGANALAYMVGNIPLHDLFTSGHEFFSTVTPLIRKPAESYLFKKSMTTGQPLEGLNFKEAPGIVEHTPLGSIMNSLGLLQKGANGKLYMSDKTENMLGLLPVYTTFRDFLTQDPERAKQRIAAFASFATGQQLTEVTKQSLTNEEAAFFFDQVEPMLTSLRNLGYKLPTVDDLQTAGVNVPTLGGPTGAPALPGPSGFTNAFGQ